MFRRTRAIVLGLACVAMAACSQWGSEERMNEGGGGGMGTDVASPAPSPTPGSSPGMEQPW
jgi:hypothetical protein